jgi:hypothetical protein
MHRTLLLCLAVAVLLASAAQPAAGTASPHTASARHQTTAAASSRPPALGLAAHLGGPATAVDVQGSYAYAMFGRDLTVLSIADPSHPSRLGYMALNEPPYTYIDINKVVVQGRYAYIFRTDGLQPAAAIHVVDIGNPLFPHEITAYHPPQPVRDLALAGMYAYITEEDGLHIVDMANPVTPHEVGLIPLEGGTIKLNGRYAYITGGLASGEVPGVLVVDIAKPRTPAIVSSTTFDPIIAGITIAGQYAYAIGYTSSLSLFIMSLAIPTAPKIVGVAPSGFAIEPAEPTIAVFVLSCNTTRREHV